jgi:hypothetical protein
MMCDIGSVLPSIVTASFVMLANRAWEHPIRNSVSPMCWLSISDPNMKGGFATSRTPRKATGSDIYVALWTGCPRTTDEDADTKHGVMYMNTMASCMDITESDQYIEEIAKNPNIPRSPSNPILQVCMNTMKNTGHRVFQNLHHTLKKQMDSLHHATSGTWQSATTSDF